MARRYRYEHLQRKKARKARREERLAQMTKREKEIREAIGWIAYILIVMCATYLIVTYVGQRTQVSGPSMQPTLYDGDNLILDKITYRFRDPKRFEIIVFPYEHMEDTFYIKRVIGLPGETVQIVDGYVYVNGERLDESYGMEVIDENKYGSAATPTIVGEDEYFVLGDNRNHSSDSRDSSVGLIKKDRIVGRAWVRIWPLKSFGVISHE